MYFTAGNSGWTSTIKVENNQVSTQQTIQPNWVLNEYMHFVLSKLPNGEVKLFLNGNLFYKHTGSQLDRFDMLELRNHNNVNQSVWVRELAMYNSSNIYPEPFLINDVNSRYSRHLFNPTFCLYSQTKQVDISQSTSDYYWLDNNYEKIPVTGSWTLKMDLWFSHWSSALGQSIARYGTKQGQSGHGHRTSAQYLMLNMYYPSSGSPQVFINDQNGDITIATFNNSVIQAQTWFTLKIYYNHNEQKYYIYADDTLYGEWTIVRSTHVFTEVNNILWMSPDISGKAKNVILHDGIAIL